MRNAADNNNAARNANWNRLAAGVYRLQFDSKNWVHVSKNVHNYKWNVASYQNNSFAFEFEAKSLKEAKKEIAEWLEYSI